ncbi:MAG: M15 family metallopeptidase [Acidimicrobiia bacterium]
MTGGRRIRSRVLLIAHLAVLAAACKGDSSFEGTTSVTMQAIESVTSVVASQPSTTVARGSWFLVWTSARLPDGFEEILEELPGVDAVSVVWAGNAPITETRESDGKPVDQAPEGFWYPVELQWIDPEAHRPFVPPDVADLLAGMSSDEVLLTESSAELRRLGSGATIGLAEGIELRVVGVVADRWVGAAELVTTSPGGADLGANVPRYAIVRYAGTREDLERALVEVVAEPVRVRSEDGTTVFRHADAVRSQVDIKLRFGEFALRPGDGTRIEIDPVWVDSNIVTRELSLLGTASCHRDFADMLERVMTQLEAAGLAHVIDSGAFLGCWNPRFIAGRRDLSRHAWGVAADINFGNPVNGPGSPTEPRLIDAMTEAGITSGKDWLKPDPGHFEWYGTDS